MFKAISQFFTAMFTLFSAVEKSAKSLDNIAGIAEAESAGLAQQMAIERKAQLAALTHKLKAA